MYTQVTLLEIWETGAVRNRDFIEKKNYEVHAPFSDHGLHGPTQASQLVVVVVVNTHPRPALLEDISIVVGWEFARGMLQYWYYIPSARLSFQEWDGRLPQTLWCMLQC